MEQKICQQSGVLAAAEKASYVADMPMLGGFVGPAAAVKILPFDKVRFSLTRFVRQRGWPYQRLVDCLLHARRRVHHLPLIIYTS
jgi:hypothetical protein